MNTNSEGSPGSGAALEDGGIYTGRVISWIIAKGYGFVLLPSGHQVFFHGSRLLEGGYALPSPGDEFTFVIGRNSKGWTVQEIVSVRVGSPGNLGLSGAKALVFNSRSPVSSIGEVASGAASRMAPVNGGTLRLDYSRPSPIRGTWARLTVKWFNAEKGFGFFMDPAGKVNDVFVHETVLKKSGLIELTAGMEADVLYIEVPRGLEASAVRNI